MQLSYVSFLVPIQYRFRRCSELDVSKHDGLSLTLLYLPDLHTTVVRIEERDSSRDVPLANVSSYTIASSSLVTPEASKTSGPPATPPQAQKPTRTIESDHGLKDKKGGKK